MVNYYRKFIPNISTFLQPLNALLQPNKTGKWTDLCTKTFEQAKKAISSSQVLAHYDSKSPLTLAGDASAYEIGTVISHILPNGFEKPIAFSSYILSPSKHNYSQIENGFLSYLWCKEISPIFVRMQVSTHNKPQALVSNFRSKERCPSLSSCKITLMGCTTLCIHL